MPDPESPRIDPPEEDIKSRFRRLTAASPNDEALLAPSSIEDLPEDVQTLLIRSGRVAQSGSETGLPEGMERQLREQGYVLNLDSRGLRISGAPSIKTPATGALSPYDIVRMAADLEGGVVKQDQLRSCPKCNATLRPGAESCQWCDEKVDG